MLIGEDGGHGRDRGCEISLGLLDCQKVGVASIDLEMDGNRGRLDMHPETSAVARSGTRARDRFDVHPGASRRATSHEFSRRIWRRVLKVLAKSN